MARKEHIPRASLAIPCLLIILFIINGLPIIPYIGIQTDEALFSSALFPGASAWFEISIFKKKVPLMVMPYIGTLKSGLYAVVFRFFEPGVYSLRVPVLLLGAASVAVYYFLLCRIATPALACFGAALLAVDSAYLLSVVMDWGPVAIQHLCLVWALLLLVKTHQDNNLHSLAQAMFLLGLGLWDKALFIWLLIGLAVAGAVVFHQEIKRNLKPKTLIVATVFFLLGALPLVIYNIRRPLETFRGNTVFSTEDLKPKLNLLPVTMNGSVFFGFLVEEDWPVQPRPPRTTLEKWSARLAAAAGERRQHLYWWAFLAALLLVPALARSRWRKTTLCSVVFMAVAWVQMLATKGAGGGAHHTILLWPFPLLLITVASGWVAEKLRGWGTVFLASFGLLLCGSALLVNNHYFAQAVRNGAPGPWTSAHFTLVEEIRKQQPAKIFVVDWGLFDNTRLLTQGRIPLYNATEPLTRPHPTAADWAYLEGMLKEPGAIFITNTEPRQAFAGVNRRLGEMAHQLGYRQQTLQIIADGHGRPCFEIYRFFRTQP